MKRILTSFSVAAMLGCAHAEKKEAQAEASATAALQKQVQAQQTQINDLKSQIVTQQTTAEQTQINELRSQLGMLQTQVTGLQIQVNGGPAPKPAPAYAPPGAAPRCGRPRMRPPRRPLPRRRGEREETRIAGWGQTALAPLCRRSPTASKRAIASLRRRERGGDRGLPELRDGGPAADGPRRALRSRHPRLSRAGSGVRR